VASAKDDQVFPHFCLGTLRSPGSRRSPQGAQGSDSGPSPFPRCCLGQSPKEACILESAGESSEEKKGSVGSVELHRMSLGSAEIR
jgi:hypothetical protein